MDLNNASLDKHVGIEKATVNGEVFALQKSEKLSSRSP